MGYWYTTREAVKIASEISAISNSRIDDAIESASRTIEGKLHRRFYPETDVRYFNWPNRQYSRPWRLWLESNELVSVTSLVSGGTTIATSDYLLRRADDKDEPPYDYVEVDLSSNAAFSAGSTFQQSIVITGVYGYNQETKAAGTCVEALTSSETDVDISNTSVIGVGSLIKIDDEWMKVTEKSWLDSGDAVGSNIAANAGVTTVAVTSGATFVAGEIILIGAEKMLVTDIAGNNLIVKRAYDGTVLAAHTATTDIYVPRTLTVERGVLGSTAASHLINAPISVLVIPGTIRKLATALAIDQIQQESSGYGRVIGSGENQREAAGRAIRHAWEEAKIAYGRMGRIGAV